MDGQRSAAALRSKGPSMPLWQISLLVIVISLFVHIIVLFAPLDNLSLGGKSNIIPNKDRSLIIHLGDVLQVVRLNNQSGGDVFQVDRRYNQSSSPYDESGSPYDESG
jgi:hypothetical protein